MLLLLGMAAAALDRRIHALFIDLLVAVLAHFVGRLLITVHICIAQILIMAAGAFINHHDLILGMMAGCAGICLLVLTMREVRWLSRRFGLQCDLSRTYAYFDAENITGKEQHGTDYTNNFEQTCNPH